MLATVGNKNIYWDELMGLKQVVGFSRMKIERRARWDKRWRPIDSFFQGIETWYWRRRGFILVECYGDSHVKVFRRLNWQYPELPFRFRSVSVMGATAYGIGSVESTTAARQIFDIRLQKLGGDVYRLFLLGEVDCGFLAYFLAEKRGVLPHDVINISLDRYESLLLSVKDVGDKVIVCSVPLPTVDRPELNPDYMAIRRQVKSSIYDRTELTRYFNAKLKDICIKNDIFYLDLDPVSLDANTGLVVEALKGSDQTDHHYDEIVYSKLLRDALVDMFNWRGAFDGG